MSTLPMEFPVSASADDDITEFVTSPETIPPSMTHLIHQKLTHAVQPDTDQNGKEEILKHVQTAIADYMRKLQTGRRLLSEEQERYFSDFFCSLARERGARAADVESMEVHEAAERANSLFRNPVYSIMCVDGRINPTLVFGMIAQMNGGVKETPAGDTNDFANTVSGNVTLLSGSSTDLQMQSAFLKYDNVNQVLDSHVACAAREKHNVALGEPVFDHGLLQDVLRKRDIADAMHARVARHYSGKTVTPMQISYDPHDGYLYMGLETDTALQVARKDGKGFTSEVLRHLADSGSIVHTKALVADPEINLAFASAYGAFAHAHDWKERYRFTAHQFWDAIATMRPTLAPLLIKKLTDKHGPFPKGLPDAELQDRATLLLSSAFNGYCNSGGPEPRHFEFADHEETFVQVSKRDFRPCHNMGFSVDSTDLANVATNVEFASTIVRANRLAKRVDAPSGSTSESFAAAPVPITVKEILSDDISEEQWAALDSIDWSFLQNLPDGKDWSQLSKEEFIREFEQKNKGVSGDLVLALSNLRDMMSALYDNRQGCRELLTSGKLVALPILTDKNRRFRSVAPFFLKGFSDADV